MLIFFFFSLPGGKESGLFRCCLSLGHLGDAIEVDLFDHVESAAQRTTTQLGHSVWSLRVGAATIKPATVCSPFKSRIKPRFLPMSPKAISLFGVLPMF